MPIDDRDETNQPIERTMLDGWTDGRMDGRTDEHNHQQTPLINDTHTRYTPSTYLPTRPGQPDIFHAPRATTTTTHQKTFHAHANPSLSGTHSRSRLAPIFSLDFLTFFLFVFFFARFASVHQSAWFFFPPHHFLPSFFATGICLF